MASEWAHQTPIKDRTGHACRFGTFSSFLGGDERDIPSVFFHSGNVSSNEQLHKIEQILARAISWKWEKK